METLGFAVDISRLPEGRFKETVMFFENSQFTKNEPGVILNGLPIIFDPNYKKIGINLSGGADSTMLLYILCRIITDLKLDTKIVPLCVARFWEHAQHVDQAKRDVIKYIGDKFPDILLPAQWGFLPTAFEFTPMDNLVFKTDECRKWRREHGFAHTADIYFFEMFGHWAGNLHGLDAIYEGTTTNPPQDVQLPGVPDFREASQKKIEYVPLVANLKSYAGKRFLLKSPFDYIEKNWVSAQYQNFGVEDLYQLTVSCETKPGGCGNCFHCSERDWAWQNREMFLEANMSAYPEFEKLSQVV